MRRIGSFPNESSANLFADYLYTQSIETAIDCDEADGGAWVLWIRDEQHVDRAKHELAEFQSTPDAARFQAGAAASQLRHRHVDERLQRMAKQQVNSNPRPGTTSGGRGEPTELKARQHRIPVTIAIIVASVIISFTTNFGQPRGSAIPGKVTLEQRTYNALSFVDRSEYQGSGGDAFASVRKGEAWRVLTPLLLHGDEFHLAFNMLWIFFLGSTIERLHGSWFFLGLTLLTQTAGMMLQVLLPVADWLPASLHGTPFAIGASGAVYGLLGFLWIRPMVDARYPLNLDSTTIVLMLGWLVACLTPLIPNVANGAHIGGLLAGMLVAAAAYLSTRRRRQPI